MDGEDFVFVESSLICVGIHSSTSLFNCRKKNWFSNLAPMNSLQTFFLSVYCGKENDGTWIEMFS